MKTRMIIGVVVAVVGILSFLVFIGTNQSTQVNQETEKTPIKISPQIQNPPTKSVELKPEPVTEPVQVETELGQPEPTPESITESIQPEKKECSGTAKCFAGKVTKILDGDTIKVDGKTIRFALTSTPELDEPGGMQARDYVQRICPEESIATVDEDDGQTEGSHGRIIAKIYCNGIILNEEILKENLGIISIEFCSKSEFASEPWAQFECK